MEENRAIIYGSVSHFLHISALKYSVNLRYNSLTKMSFNLIFFIIVSSLRTLYQYHIRYIVLPKPESSKNVQHNYTESDLALKMKLQVTPEKLL